MIFLRKEPVRSAVLIGIVWLMAALLAAAVGMACTGDDDSTESASSDDAVAAHSDAATTSDGHAGDADDHSSDADAHSDDEDAHTDAAPADVEVVVRSLDLLRFEPDEIRVTVGQRVRLVLDNAESSALHDFTIEEMDVADVHAEGAAHAHQDESADYAVHVAAEPGQTAAIEFTPTKAGTYEFLCTVPGHATAGMVGTLVVEP